MNGSSGLLIASKLIAVVVLVLANGFFVATEFALVSLRRSRVEQLVAEGHLRAKASRPVFYQGDRLFSPLDLV